MAKKKYSAEFVLAEMSDSRRWMELGNTKRRYIYRRFCKGTFCRLFAISRKLLTDRKHRVRITIEFLEELKKKVHYH